MRRRITSEIDKTLQRLRRLLRAKVFSKTHFEQRLKNQILGIFSRDRTRLLQRTNKKVEGKKMSEIVNK